MFSVFSLKVLPRGLILLQSTEKACKQKVSFIYLEKKLTFLNVMHCYFETGAMYFLLKSIEIAERSNLILPAPVSIVTVLSVVLISAILP